MTSSTVSPWQRELDDFVRALSGAFLLGVPLLFTMEMWWLGSYERPWKLLVLLGIALAANVALAQSAGFRERPALGNSVEQAIDAVAVGAFASAIVLLVLNRVAIGDPLDTVLGKIVVQAVPLSLGASVATMIFGAGRGDRRGDADTAASARSPWQAALKDAGATVTGGIFIGFSIAPTEEVLLLAAELTPPHLLALIALSLALTYAIVFESGFDPNQIQPRYNGLYQSAITETTAAYAVSLVVAVGALLLFNASGLTDSPQHLLGQVLVLGLPTAIGGAAGRLVL